MAAVNIPLIRFAHGGATGAVSAYFLTGITPLSGFYFGGVFRLVRAFVDEGLSCLGNSTVARTTRFVLSVLVAATVAAATANLCGLVVTFDSALVIIAVNLVIIGLTAGQQQQAAAQRA